MKRIAALLGVIGLTTAAFAMTAQAGRAFMVTGGGQITVGTEGPGDTIAFTARDIDGDAGDLAKGQVQYVDREDGEVVEVYHGAVSCLVAVEGAGTDGAAYLAGQWSNQGSGDFEIYVEDNGEPNQGADQIFIDQEDAFNCSDDNDDDEPTALGRGNVQVHQAN